MTSPRYVFVGEHRYNSEFQHLVWDVEFSKQFMRRISNNRMEKQNRKYIFRLIMKLASGLWANIAEKLSNESNLRLYKSSISNYYILWEIAISFSSRVGSYVELIRIWDLTKDSELYSLVENIELRFRNSKSYSFRKLFTKVDCDDGKSLREDNDSMTRIRPCIFELSTSHDHTDEHHISKEHGDHLFWLVPAGKEEEGFLITKFHCCTAELLSKYCGDSDDLCNINNFPLALWKEEYDICNIIPNPFSSILLLGRSGTGKTTCLIYRLYQHYIDQLDNPGYSNDGEGHFNQLFITSNPTLREEVRKAFQGLIGGSCGTNLNTYSTSSTFETTRQTITMFSTFNDDIPSHEFPLFLTKREWIVMLDGTLVNPFFPRLPGTKSKLDPVVETKAYGADYQRTSSNLLDIWEDVDDEEKDDEDDMRGLFLSPVKDVVTSPSATTSRREENSHQKSSTTSSTTTTRARVLGPEVDYDYFQKRMYRRLPHAAKYNATMVWSDMMSLIKGSAGAIKNGPLTAEQYYVVGKKKGPNFVGSREEVYEMFQQYEILKGRSRAFDMCDVVRHIYRELCQHAREGSKGESSFGLCRGYTGTRIHELYVDEIQDFLEGEIMLMLAMVDPNRMFLSGDDAQTIASGVSFRFCDVNSLFREYKEFYPLVGIPKTIKLTTNYRTHSGILNLANSVIQLIYDLFPKAIDRLDFDQGIFDGPKPYLLYETSHRELTTLLSDEKSGKRIDFGAEQCVIVHDRASKAELPDDIRCGGIVCSIFESKGLEFNEVLLYNFFTDSPARGLWRSIRNPRENAAAFDKDLNRIVLEELKRLYTAITRARRKLWIYDESPEFRHPMFQYWTSRGLAESGLSVKSRDSAVKSSFTAISTPSASESQKLLEKGRVFYERKSFMNAFFCFDKAGDTLQAKLALAYGLVNNQILPKDVPIKYNDNKTISYGGSDYDRKRFLFAAVIFRELGSLSRAVMYFKKAEEFHEAGDIYKNLGRYLSAAKCYDRGANWENAANCMFHCKLYEEALIRFGKCGKDEFLKGVIKLIEVGFLEKTVEMLIDRSFLHDKTFMDRAQAQHIDMDSLYITAIKGLLTRKSSFETVFPHLRAVSARGQSTVESIIRAEGTVLFLAKYFMRVLRKYEEGVEIVLSSYDDYHRLLTELTEASVDDGSKEFKHVLGQTYYACRKYEKAEEMFRTIRNLKLASLSHMVSLAKSVTACQRTSEMYYIIDEYYKRKSVLALFWGLEQTVRNGTPLHKIFVPSVEKKVQTLCEWLTLIVKAVTAMDVAQRRSCAEFFEFQESEIRPGYSRYDRLAARLRDFIGIPLNEHESPSSMVYYITPTDTLISKIRFVVLRTMVNEWNLAESLSGLVVNTNTHIIIEKRFQHILRNYQNIKTFFNTLQNKLEAIIPTETLSYQAEYNLMLEQINYNDAIQHNLIIALRSAIRDIPFFSCTVPLYEKPFQLDKVFEKMIEGYALSEIDDLMMSVYKISYFNDRYYDTRNMDDILVFIRRVFFITYLADSFSSKKIFTKLYSLSNKISNRLMDLQITAALDWQCLIFRSDQSLAALPLDHQLGNLTHIERITRIPRLLQSIRHKGLFIKASMTLICLENVLAKLIWVVAMIANVPVVLPLSVCFHQLGSIDKWKQAGFVIDSAICTNHRGTLSDDNDVYDLLNIADHIMSTEVTDSVLDALGCIIDLLDDGCDSLFESPEGVESWNHSNNVKTTGGNWSVIVKLIYILYSNYVLHEQRKTDSDSFPISYASSRFCYEYSTLYSHYISYTDLSVLHNMGPMMHLNELNDVYSKRFQNDKLLIVDWRSHQLATVIDGDIILSRYGLKLINNEFASATTGSCSDV